MGLSFFAYNEENKKAIFRNNFFLVKNGFSLEELYSIPTNEYYEYVKILNDYNKEKDKQSSTSNKSIKRPKTVGNTTPRKR